MGETPRETYPDSVLSTSKFTWSDRDMNLGPRRMIWIQKWWNEICEGENGRNPKKNLPRLRFVQHKIHMESSRHELGTPQNDMTTEMVE